MNEPSNPPIAHWTPPRCGWYKINVDGAVFKESGSCGVGVVIRNEEGLLMGAISMRVELLLKALEVEARAVQEGIQLAWELGLREVIIEGDAQGVIKALQNFEVCLWPVQNVVKGSLQCLSYFKAWSTSHVRRGGNEASHLMAKMAKSLSTCKIWVEDILSIIVYQVLTNVTNMLSVSVN